MSSIRERDERREPPRQGITLGMLALLALGLIIVANAAVVLQNLSL